MGVTAGYVQQLFSNRCGTHVPLAPGLVLLASLEHLLQLLPHHLQAAGSPRIVAGSLLVAGQAARGETEEAGTFSHFVGWKAQRGFVGCSPAPKIKQPVPQHACSPPSPFLHSGGCHPPWPATHLERSLSRSCCSASTCSCASRRLPEVRASSYRQGAAVVQQGQRPVGCALTETSAAVICLSKPLKQANKGCPAGSPALHAPLTAGRCGSGPPPPRPAGRPPCCPPTPGWQSCGGCQHGRGRRSVLLGACTAGVMPVPTAQAMGRARARRRETWAERHAGAGVTQVRCSTPPRLLTAGAAGCWPPPGMPPPQAPPTAAAGKAGVEPGLSSWCAAEE